MLRAEGSGAVRIFRHTADTDTELLVTSRFPNSARHKRKFMVAQKMAINRKATRANMEGRSGGREIQDLPDFHPVWVQAGIELHQCIHGHVISPSNRTGRFAGLDLMFSSSRGIRCHANGVRTKAIGVGRLRRTQLRIRLSRGSLRRS